MTEIPAFPGNEDEPEQDTEEQEETRQGALPRVPEPEAQHMHPPIALIRQHNAIQRVQTALNEGIGDVELVGNVLARSTVESIVEMHLTEEEFRYITAHAGGKLEAALLGVLPALLKEGAELLVELRQPNDE